ncbi:hypothetical protein K449DRAFT_381882 [Hypoxylon sp. EC38]|nr:hypothetical protein K449DRAFT_381882 [Hypoxylon sp. EC38]
MKADVVFGNHWSCSPSNPNGAAKVTRGYQSSPDAQACCSYDGDEAPALLAWAGTVRLLNGTKNIDIGSACSNSRTPIRPPL